MKTTVWKAVVGYEGNYEVSDDGQVRSVERKDKAGRNTLPVRIMHQSPTHKGYLRVALTDRAGKTIKHTVHKIVLLAFVGPKPEGMEGCHNDRDKKNNSVSNLRWDTPVSNWQDRRMHGTASVAEAHPMAKLTNEIVRKIKLGIAANIPSEILKREFRISTQMLCSIRTGRTWRSVNV